MKVENNRIISLDVFRALALLLICFFHWFAYRGTYIGVVIFFALSGYLFTPRQLLNENISHIMKGTRRRIGKIYPSLLVVILVSTIGVYLINGGLEIKYKYSALASILAYNNLYQIWSKMSYFDNFGMLMPLTHIWALSFQFQMYLFIPFFVILLKKLKLKNRTIGIIFLLLSLVSAGIMAYLYALNPDADPSRVYYGTDTRAFAFLVASATGIFYSNREITDKKEKVIVRILGILGIAVILFFSFQINYDNPLNYYGLMYLASLLFSFTIVQFSKIEVKIFENEVFRKIISPVVRLGQHQYQYYLWQYPIMVFCKEAFKWSKLSHGQQFAVQAVILIAVSEVSYILFEKESWNLKILKDRLKQKEILKIASFSVLGMTAGILLASPIYQNTDLEEMKKIQAGGTVEIAKADEGKADEAKSQETENQEAKADEKKSGSAENENLSPKEDEEEQQKILDALPTDEREILFVGDSVLDMTKTDLKKKYPNAVIETKVGRQFYEFPKLLQMYISQGKAKKIVVIALGTNGTIYKKDIQKVMELLKDREVYMINTVMPDPWEKSVNEEIANAARENPNVKVIDWYSYSKGKKDYFYKDGTHPKPHAAKRYVNLLYSQVSKGD